VNLRNAPGMRSIVLACMALLVCAAPAGAVVGGQPIAPETVPWFASGDCGGMLVAPDRVLTAGHCVKGNTINGIAGWAVGGVTRNGTQFALHPNWRKTNGENLLDDVALVQLDEPVTTVEPVTLGTSVPKQGVIVGRGRSTAPGSGRTEPFDGKHPQATQKTTSDTECAKEFKHERGNGGERFDAKRMLCAIDVDGKAPLSSGCNGDSGGPLYTGSPAAPVLLGVVSFGGSRCGADHLPSVFADVRHYRSFIADPDPIWAPVPLSASTITGTPKVGSTLTCGVSGYSSEPDTVQFTWKVPRGARQPVVGRRSTYTVRKEDAGRQVLCEIVAGNDGGISTAPFDSHSKIKIPR
jgi:hypothetical protein